MLRSGYAALGVAFGALAGSIVVPGLVLPGLALAFVAGILLAFSDDDMPKWAGISIVGYFLLTAILFLAATPITVNRGERFFVNPAPPELANEVFLWLGLLSPLILAGAGIAAAWEREHAPRILLFGALAGFALVAILSIVLVPGDTDPGGARAQGSLLQMLFALSALAGAAGALWAASRPEDVA
jgi:hypothetical protein